MTPDEIQTRIAGELRSIPRGEPGSPQNELRMQFQVRRSHSLRAGSKTAVSAAAVMDQAIRSVRQHYPDFEPVAPPATKP